MMEKRNAHMSLMAKPEGERPLKKLCVSCRIILKSIVVRLDVEV
jgi:hypothetical protein